MEASFIIEIHIEFNKCLPANSYTCPWQGQPTKYWEFTVQLPSQWWTAVQNLVILTRIIINTQLLAIYVYRMGCGAGGRGRHMIFSKPSKCSWHVKNPDPGPGRTPGSSAQPTASTVIKRSKCLTSDLFRSQQCQQCQSFDIRRVCDCRPRQQRNNKFEHCISNELEGNLLIKLIADDSCGCGMARTAIIEI